MIIMKALNIVIAIIFNLLVGIFFIPFIVVALLMGLILRFKNKNSFPWQYATPTIHDPALLLGNKKLE